MSNRITVKQWLLQNYTDESPVNLNYGTAESNFKYNETEYDLGDDSLLKEGEYLVETLYLSNDPAQIGWFSSRETYFPKSPLNVPAPARGLGKVIQSKSAKFPQGTYVQAGLGWTTHAILSESTPAVSAVEDPKALPKLSNFLSIFGITTLTAYFDVFKYAELKEGDGKDKTFLVTAAAGGVGLALIHFLTKIIQVKKIIAIAGSDGKVDYLSSLDESIIALNYKSATFAADFEAKAQSIGGIDYFFDQVGGDVLGQAVTLMNPHGKILQCGLISSYNDKSKDVLVNYSTVVLKRLTIKGLVLIDDFANVPAAIAAIAGFIKQGKLDVAAYRETIADATGGNFNKIPELWNGLFSGANYGKYITKVSDTE